MIDILLAAYNGEKYLGQQIDSILGQTNRDWRLLIRDDGSNDNTIAIIESCSRAHPDRIKVIRDDRGHLGATLNFAALLEYAGSEYIMLSDQDDVWLPSKIDLTLIAMKKAENQYPDKPLMVHTDLKVVDSNLNTTADSFWAYSKISPAAGDTLKKIIYRNIVTGCTVMINQKAREIVTPIPPQARVHDWWMAINVAKAGRIIHLATPTVLYRQHPQNVIGAASRPMTPRIFLKKLSRFASQFSNDYRIIRKVYPSVNPFTLLWNSIRFRPFKRSR